MDVTPQHFYLNRRKFLKNLASAGLLSSLYPYLPASAKIQNDTTIITPIDSALSYNNYYEFSTNKEVVKHISKQFKTSPWTLTIEGEVDRVIKLSLDDLFDLNSVKRTYPLRCVEGWSMVIPWQGIELNEILKLAGIKSTAKYVKFIGTFRPEEMVNQRRKILPWPYTEGLRIDEAMHPLTLLATGMYNQSLSTQNGAPMRLVVPWKYGFKSIKAIQKIVLQKDRPKTSWNQQIPSEYGFYANVNPSVPHPRWSQSREVRIGELKKRRTLPFNGFEIEVQNLYKDMDLHSNF